MPGGNKYHDRSWTLALVHYSIPKSLSSLFSIHKSLSLLLPGTFLAPLIWMFLISTWSPNYSNDMQKSNLLRTFPKLAHSFYLRLASPAAGSVDGSQDAEERGEKLWSAAEVQLPSWTSCLLDLTLSLLPLIPLIPLCYIDANQNAISILKWRGPWRKWSPKWWRQDAAVARRGSCATLATANLFPRQLRIRHAKWQFLAHVIGSGERPDFPGGLLRSAFKLFSRKLPPSIVKLCFFASSPRSSDSP